MSSSTNINYTLSAIDKITPVLKDIEKLSKKVQASLKMTASVTANTQSASGAISKLAKTPLKINGAVSVDTSEIDAAIAKAKKASADIRNVSFGLNGITTTKKFGNNGNNMTISESSMPSIPGLGWAAGAAAVGLVAKKSVQVFADLETEQYKLAKTLGVGLKSDKLKAYTAEMRKLSIEVGMSNEELTEQATQFAKVDSSRSAEQLAKMVKTAAANTKEWEVDIGLIVKTMSSLQDTFKMTDKQVADTMDKIGMLGDEMGILSEAYIVDFMATNAALMSTSGFNADQILAIAAAAGEAQVQVSEAGNMIKVLSKELSKISNEDLGTLGINADVFRKMGKPEQIDAVLMGLNSIVKQTGLTEEQLNNLDAKGRQELFMKQGAKMGVDVSQLFSSIVGNNYDDVIGRIAAQYGKSEKAKNLMGDPKNYEGRAMKGLAGEAETANGKFSRLKAYVMAGLSDIGGAFYEAFAGDWIMPLWDSIGGNFSRVFALFGDGAGNATGALEVLKFAVGGIAGVIKVLAVVFEVVFLAIKGIVEVVVNLFMLDFMGAIDAISTRFNDFLNIFKLGSTEVETKITSVQKTTAPVVAQALPNSNVGGMSYDVAQKLAFSQAQTTNTAKQATNAQTIDIASKNILQASNFMLQAAQTPVKVQTTAATPLAGLGDQGRG